MWESQFHVSVPAQACFLKALRAYFTPVLAEFFSREEADRLVLALDESCSNVIKHQAKPETSGRISVRLDVAAHVVRFEVCDYCCEDDIPHIKPRDLDKVRPGGLGMHFINEIMDNVEFKPDRGRPDRMSLVLEKARPRAASKTDE